MQSNRFSLRDAVALFVVGVVLATTILTGCGNSVKYRMQNGTQVRGVQQAMVLFSQSNNTFYPARNSDGNDNFAAIAASATQWGAGALHDDDISKVYAILITAEFFTPDYIISPQDNLDPHDGATTGKPGTITNKHYSYALIDMNDAESNRRREWKDTNNSQAPIVADPSKDIRPMDDLTYHADGADSDTAYQGNIAWNDNHVTFETKGLFPAGDLKIGSAPNQEALNPFTNTANDGAKFIW